MEKKRQHPLLNIEKTIGRIKGMYCLGMTEASCSTIEGLNEYLCVTLINNLLSR